MSTGDFGKAGQEGLAALMAQRESMNKFDTDMIKLESDLVLNNARLEAARRTGAAAANKSAFSASEYAALERAYSEAVERANQTKSQPDMQEAIRLKEILQGARTAVAAKFGVTGTTPTSGSGNYDVSSKTT
jgi:predicted  nucleic acid-binding Zn-ribbon protein